jgi:N-acetylneuraminic acid mutarotase
MGGRYYPASNTWMAMTANGQPSGIGRRAHSAVWTGTEMIVWGGYSGFPELWYFNDGGRYNPRSDAWVAIATNGAPTGRAFHLAVWTGTEMIVWGGTADNFNSIWLNNGARYNPATDSWTPVSTNGAPGTGSGSVWTGKEMIVWGTSRSAGRYDPVADSWTAITTNGAPTGGVTAVWTGNEMMVWGRGGARYNPSVDHWTAITTNGAPAFRSAETSIWTGSQMIIFGGTDGTNFLNTVYLYTPPAPLLSILGSAGNVTLSWSTNFPGLTLEQSGLLPTESWSLVSPAPVVSGANYVVTNSLGNSNQFYRVRSR